MPINATAPIALPAAPARTLDRWWLQSLTLNVLPTGTLQAAYLVCRGDAAGPVPAQALPRRAIPDLAALFADNPAALAQIAQAEALILGVIQADLQARGQL